MGAETSQQRSLFAPPSPTPDDAAWIGQVKEDAGRWWASTEREKVVDTCPLVLSGWTRAIRVVHRQSGDEIGGDWPSRESTKLWLWLALGIVQWQLAPDVATARQEHGAELDAAEARLRLAMGGAS